MNSIGICNAKQARAWLAVGLIASAVACSGRLVGDDWSNDGGLGGDASDGDVEGDPGDAGFRPWDGAAGSVVGDSSDQDQDLSQTLLSKISAGNGATCGVTQQGAVKCWGRNDKGTLGVGLDGDVLVPSDVLGLGSNVVDVSTSGTENGVHTCALTSSGGVHCWGDNTYGQLGTGSGGARSVPTAVPGLDSGVVAISTGGCKTCAINAAGGLLCWGWNECDDDFISTKGKAKAAPTIVPGLDSGVVAVSAGDHQTCVIMSSGFVRCWGLDFSVSPARVVAEPTVVLGLDAGAVAITVGGYHACALTWQGAVLCWGDGWCVMNQSTNVATPVNWLDKGIIAVSAGSRNTIAIDAAGCVVFWGFSQANKGSAGCSSLGYLYTGTPRIMAISAGQRHICRLNSLGLATCWGTNMHGELGLGEVGDW